MVGTARCAQPIAATVRRRRRRACWAAAALLAVVPNAGVHAADLGDVDGWDVRWDNTLRYTAAFRLSGQNGALIADPNADDGDRNFSPGLVSDRFDLLSELDVSNGNFGVDVSADGWYDTVYHQSNHNNSPATFNPYSVPHNQFTRATEVLQGEDADLLNAFVHDSFDVGDTPVSFRLGRNSLLWGESLYFASNGIAAGQAPIDEIKAASEPEAEAKEVYLPVDQVSLTIQPRPNLALSAYYQFEWRRSRLPASGSYFSDADYLDAGGERLIVAPGQYLYRGTDQRPDWSGQFGLAVTATVQDFDLGLYAIRFDAKEPELYLLPGVWSNPAIGRVGTYQLVFPTDIDTYGASFSTYIGQSTLAGEVSMRNNMPLVSAANYALASGGGGGGYGAALAGAGYNAALQPAGPPGVTPTYVQNTFAIGRTLHGQLSSVSTLSPTSMWDGADFSAELAANDVLEVTQYRADLAPGRTGFAAAMRAVFEPRYFEVLPALDLSVPVGLGYDLVGRSSTDSSLNAGAGDVELGVSATYRAVWQGSITLTHFIGSPNRQPFADRDFISLSLERTF
jgi:hypothetical protein